MKSVNKVKMISLALLLFGILALAPAAMAATVTTDQEDYAPWELVTINGSGFEPSAPITLTIEWPDGFVDQFYGQFNENWDFIWSSTTCDPELYDGAADDQGSFYLMFGKIKYFGKYVVVATDGITTVTTTFTDAVNIHSVTSSDSSGTTKAAFLTSEDVYAHITTTGNGTNPTVRIYVVASAPANNDSLTDVSGGYETEMISGTTTAEVWHHNSTLGTYYIVVDESPYGVYNGGEQISSAFTVSAPAAPTVTNVSPASGEQGASIGSVIITGTNLTGVTLVGFGAGITVNSYAVDSATQITADITIDGAATLGFRDVSVTTLGGTGTLTNGFSVTEASVPTPTVTNVSPASGDQGESISGVIITGTNLTDATVISFGPGITVDSFLVDNSTQITANITIDGAATLGFRNVSVTTPGGTGTLINGFSVTEASVPTYLVHYVATGNDVPVTVPDDEWLASGDPATGVFPSPVTNGDGDTRSVYVSDDRPGVITGPTTITATYDNEYLVEYAVTGNDVPVTVPPDEWVASGDPATGVFPSPVTNGAGDTRSVYVSDDRPGVITGPTTITATYGNEYLVEYAVTGNVVPVTPPDDEWVASGEPATGVFPSPVTNGAGDTRSVYVGDDRAGVITGPTTITATYDNEYLVEYAVTGNVVPVAPPDDEWVASGEPATGVFPSPVTNGAGDTRSVYVSDDRPPTITAPTTITATYKTQYLVTFAQSGLTDDVDEDTKVVTVDGDGIVYGDLALDKWVDSDNTVEYEYEILVNSSVPGFQFWLSSVAGPASVITVTSPVTVTGNYIELPLSAITAGGCLFDKDPGIDGQQFRLILTQDPMDPATFKLTASNPGQFFYNVFYVGAPGPVSFNITIPYPFVTQGATPIHFYSGVEVLDGCYMPYDEIGGFDISGTGTVTPNGSLGIALGDHGGVNVTLTVTGEVPDSGLAYVRIHLDYGLKKTIGYSPFENNAVNSEPIYDLTNYVFSYGGYDVTIQNENVFKKIPGFGGIVLDGDEPAFDAEISIEGPGVSATVKTDEDGFYYYYYKHKGKEAMFEVECSGQSETVAMRANRFVEVDFPLP